MTHPDDHPLGAMPWLRRALPVLCLAGGLLLGCARKPEPQTGIRVDQSGVAQRLAARAGQGETSADAANDGNAANDADTLDDADAVEPYPDKPSAKTSGQRVGFRRVRDQRNKKKERPQPDADLAEKMKPRRPDHFERTVRE